MGGIYGIRMPAPTYRTRWRGAEMISSSIKVKSVLKSAMKSLLSCNIVLIAMFCVSNPLPRAAIYAVATAKPTFEAASPEMFMLAHCFASSQHQKQTFGLPSEAGTIGTLQESGLPASMHRACKTGWVSSCKKSNLRLLLLNENCTHISFRISYTSAV